MTNKVEYRLLTHPDGNAEVALDDNFETLEEAMLAAEETAEDTVLIWERCLRGGSDEYWAGWNRADWLAGADPVTEKFEPMPWYAICREVG